MWCVVQVQSCAKRSVKLLDQAAAGQQLFDTLFLTTDTPASMYDYIFHVQIPAQEKGQMSDVPLPQRIERKVHSIITQVCHQLIIQWSLPHDNAKLL